MKLRDIERRVVPTKGDAEYLARLRSDGQGPRLKFIKKAA